MRLAVRHGKVQNYVWERQNQTFASGEWSVPHSCPNTSYTPHRIILENAPKGSDETRPRKRRRLARGVHGQHAQDMSPITPENIHQRPQWRVTPLGRLIRPMLMRPARPLGPPLHALRAKNLDKGKGKGKGSSRAKKRRARAPPTRARRQTIDPLRWGSTHLSGIFLDGDGHPPPPLRSEKDGGANGESTEVEEVEHILDVSDQTPPGDDRTPPHAGAGAELDLAAETASALDLLSTMFGGANVDWGGAESVDSDVEMAGAGAGIPHTAPGPLEPTDFEIVPADHEPRAAQRDEKRLAVDRQAETTPTPTMTGPAQPSTKLKDLFAPREEEGELLVMHDVVSLTSPARFLHRLLPYRPPRFRLGARPRNGPKTGRAGLPGRRGACACDHIQS